MLQAGGALARRLRSPCAPRRQESQERATARGEGRVVTNAVPACSCLQRLPPPWSGSSHALLSGSSSPPVRHSTRCAARDGGRFFSARRLAGAMSSAALATYRQLLRVRSQAFRGDARALAAAHKEIREAYEKVLSVEVHVSRRCVALTYNGVLPPSACRRGTSVSPLAWTRCCGTRATPRSSYVKTWSRVRASIVCRATRAAADTRLRITLGRRTRSGAHRSRQLCGAAAAAARGQAGGAARSRRRAGQRLLHSRSNWHQAGIAADGSATEPERGVCVLTWRRARSPRLAPHRCEHARCSGLGDRACSGLLRGERSQRRLRRRRWPARRSGRPRWKHVQVGRWRHGSVIVARRKPRRRGARLRCREAMLQWRRRRRRRRRRRWQRRSLCCVRLKHGRLLLCHEPGSSCGSGSSCSCDGRVRQR